MSARGDPTPLLYASRDWSDFARRAAALGSAQKGYAFEVLVKYFLQLDPKYATTLEQVWLIEEVPDDVRHHLHLPRSDEGIDLVAKARTGEYWAVQCKFREDSKISITRPELATFTDLAFSICENVALALVCTTTNRLSRKLRLYKDRLEFCSSEVWRALDDAFFERLRALLSDRRPIIKPSKPRPHQIQCVRDAYEHFADNRNSRGKLIMPCGTGKSLTAYWIAAALVAKRIVIAVPSLALIRQTIEIWTREALAGGQQLSWIAVCSDESVDDVDVSLLVQDLGFRVYTNPAEIARWLTSTTDGVMVVFTTYQSGPIVSNAAEQAGVGFDLGILDEAHRTAGRTGSVFSHLLHDANVSIRQRLFMTATERRYRGHSDEVTSMDDVRLYGETFSLLSFKAALEAKTPILSDYKVLTMIVLREEVADLIKRNALVQPDKGGWNHIEAEMLASAVALRQAMLQYPIRQAVSFHSTVARARSFKTCQDLFSSTFPDFGRLATFHVSGSMPPGERSELLRTFAASERALVTNARCLSEGVDVPNIDCVLFADPKNSVVDTVQAVGRALRPHDGKQCAYIVVPIVLDSSGANTELITSAFAPLLSVLRALASNDERIIEYFRAVLQGVRRIPHTLISIDVPVGVRIDAEAFVKAIQTQCWARLARLSWRPFEEARTFVQSLRLESQSQWKAYIANELPLKASPPKDIPCAPHLVYKSSGWTGWGDWLGTGTIATRRRKYRPFLEAREFVHALAISNQSEWRSYIANKLPLRLPLPKDIPSAPDLAYRRSGWMSWGDWLGTGVIASQRKEFRPFLSARQFARGLGLKSHREWLIYCNGKIPDLTPRADDIPSLPSATYRGKGWRGWGDWLGTEYVANRSRRYLEFTRARAFARTLGLKSETEWRQYRNRLPEEVPRKPDVVYKGKGWRGWGDWVGTARIANQRRELLPFAEARDFVRSLSLKSYAEWELYRVGKCPGKGQRPKFIPSDPYGHYKNKGWLSWPDWLGTT